ncbi:hypothetical protein HBI31_061160 [Parastagonospora nodorum]|nr:hypothetical protein HBI31_061160 [Parastagonospora nodorum]
MPVWTVMEKYQEIPHVHRHFGLGERCSRPATRMPASMSQDSLVELLRLDKGDRRNCHGKMSRTWAVVGEPRVYKADGAVRLNSPSSATETITSLQQQL